MGGADDVGDEVEEEGDYDGDMVGFEKECFAPESFRSLLWVVVEHLNASAGWVVIIIPLYLLFALESGFTCCIASITGSGCGAEVFHYGAIVDKWFSLFRFII